MIFRCLSFRLSFLGLCLSVVSLWASATVSLKNVSFPFTELEVNNYATVTINGAAANGTVSVAQNGNPPFVWGTKTDSTGHWSVTAQETTANVGNYSQIWYVNGVALNPLNPDPAYFGAAPTLPSFTVHGHYLPSNPPVLKVVNACGGPQNVTAKWIWTPVSYVFTTSYGATVVNAAAQNWNTAQSRVSLEATNAQNDITVADGTLPKNTFGQTQPYSQACDSPAGGYSPGCYNDEDECNEACLGSTAMFYADITLNTSSINGAANAMGVTPSTFATFVLTHELGHTLQLGDTPYLFGICSEIGSVESALGFFCGVSTPSSRDVNVFNGIYTSSPGYCTPGQNICIPGDACGT